mgnify:CR=1 FL=1
MNKKVSLLILSLILTIVVFIVSTNMQRKLVNFVPTIKCMVVKEDVEKYTMLNENVISYVEMPIEIVANVKIVQDINEIKDLYLKDKLYKGQIVLANQFDTKENLNIFMVEDGMEKISIKIKNSENASSFILKEDSNINLYATISNDYANSPIFDGFEKQVVGDENSGYTVIKLLSNTKILNTFNENGEYISKVNEKNIDTILLSVSPDIALKINLIRDIATFNLTEL